MFSFHANPKFHFLLEIAAFRELSLHRNPYPRILLHQLIVLISAVHCLHSVGIPQAKIVYFSVMFSSAIGGTRTSVASPGAVLSLLSLYGFTLQNVRDGYGNFSNEI
jgi:hypothetical protein